MNKLFIILLISLIFVFGFTYQGMKMSTKIGGGTSASADAITLNTGDYLLLNTGDKLLRN